VRSRGVFSPLRWLAVFFLLAALVLAIFQLVRYSRLRANLPTGLHIAGIPVGGLDRQQAAQRLLEAYTIPVELQYGDALIQLDPSVVDFQLDLDTMLAAADIQRTQNTFWEGFWDFLWGRTSMTADVPLRASFSETRLRTHLEQEIAQRYDQPPSPAQPIVGTVSFQPGTPGSSLDIDGAVVLIENALFSNLRRQVALPLLRNAPPRPAFQNLEVLIRQTIDLAEFDGLAGIYLMDLQTNQDMHLAYSQGETISVQPDIAYTASSIIKIPIMVSVFNRMGDNPDEESLNLLGEMIEKSGNETADWLMDRVIDPNRAPLFVTEDMQAIGLENTFLAGYFSLGSPLLSLEQTPANQRIDITTDPDPYSQTTPSDIGMLLEDIYICAQENGGALAAVFEGQITQEECQQMIEHLVNNKLPVLLTGGIPEGTRIAHKHGWVSLNGIINTIGDSGIIYSPGGDYILVVFLYNPVQLVWDPASALVANISRAVYNYYNLPQ
jgi:beta-lactamase class A